MGKKKKKIGMEKNSLLKKIGFYRTLQFLSSNGESIELGEFYKEFNKNGYYNQFLRIREDLLLKDIIQIRKLETGEKMISLTANGIVMKLRIRDVMQQLENG